MDIITISVFASLIGTISILLVYLYLYFLYREKYIGIWLLSYLLLLSRYAFFDSGLLEWKESALGMTVYQSTTLISSVFFVHATYLFAGRNLKRCWFYISIITIFFISILNVVFNHFFYSLIICIFLGSSVCFWIGMLFIKYLDLKGLGRIITGYTYIIWGIHNLSMPFMINISWFVPLAYSLGGILRLVIAIATLMVYFEKTRTDLAAKEKQYRLLAEKAVDIIYYFEFFPKKKLNYLSPAVLSITGYEAIEYYKNPSLFLRIVHPADRKIVCRFFRLKLNIEEPISLRLVNKNKNIVWIEQKCFPFFDDEGNMLAWEGIIRDITVRKNMEEMASILDKMTMVGNMAAAVAHEIRNPMTIVKGYLQLMQRKNLYHDDKDRLLLMIEEIDRADSIIQEYLSLSRQKVLELELLSLNLVIRAIYPLIEASASEAKISLLLELNEIPNILLDKNDIRQLLLNLVRNGIEAMPNGGILTIKTSYEEGQAVLAIIDQGMGIPENILQKLGNPFVTSKATGTGLGIPICYQIARRQNARIRIATSGKGTTFFVYFNIPKL